MLKFLEPEKSKIQAKGEAIHREPSFETRDEIEIEIETEAFHPPVTLNVFVPTNKTIFRPSKLYLKLFCGAINKRL